jgi:hypothetical protein
VQFGMGACSCVSELFYLLGSRGSRGNKHNNILGVRDQARPVPLGYFNLSHVGFVVIIIII